MMRGARFFEKTACKGCQQLQHDLVQQFLEYVMPEHHFTYLLGGCQLSYNHRLFIAAVNIFSTCLHTTGVDVRHD